jgi:hypothetical protein
MVTVTESVPTGMTLVSMNGGATWNCTVLPNCTTSSMLNGGSSYPPITVTVNVVGNAISPQLNIVAVSGGGSFGASTTDSTVIAVGTPKAVMSTPAANTTLSGSAVTFSWSAGTGASAYWLDVGTIPGQGNVFASQLAWSITSQTVNGIPTNGGTIYVRLWTQISGAWQYRDYSYMAL